MPRPNPPTLLDLVQAWNAANPDAPRLVYHAPLAYPARTNSDHLPLFGHVTVAREQGSGSPPAQTEPGPWRDAWGHSRIVDIGSAYMQVRSRPDGDVDIRQRKEYGGTWGTPRVCPIDLWRGEGWLLRTTSRTTNEQAIADWNATHSIGDTIRWWPRDSGRTCPCRGKLETSALLIPVGSTGEHVVGVYLVGVGPVPLTQIEPSL